GGNQNDAVFSVSTDMGAMWSIPARVNQGPTADGVNHYNTTVAVGADGIWRVAYRQRFETGITALTPGIDSYYQESRDQGATWTTPLKINTGSPVSDPQFGAYSRGGLFQGDYEQIAAGGNDESYFTRDESFQLPGGPSTCAMNFSDPPKTCQNQTTFVSHLLPQTVVTPDTKFVPALVLIGAVGALIGAQRLRRRRRAA